MQPIIRSEKLSQVHSDIRGPVYVEAMKMIAEGTPVLRLNTGHLRLYHAPQRAPRPAGECR